MALNLKEVFAPAAIAAYWTNDPTNAMPFASDALFPAKKKAGLDLKWLRGHKGVGISLMPSAFDTKATFRERKGFKMSETEMPFFREGFHIDEKDRQGKKRRKNRPGRALQAHEPDVPGHEQQQQLRRRGADQQAFGYVFQFHAHEYSFLYSLGLSPEYLVKVLVK